MFSFPSFPWLTCKCLLSSPLHCTVAPTDLLSASSPTQVRDTVYWRRFCLYLIPLPFIVAESLASMLPPPHPSLSCPVPRGPPLSPGLAWVERPQSGASREQTRVSLTSFLLPSNSTQSTDSDSAPPHLACLLLSGAHRHTVGLVHTHMGMYLYFPSPYYQLDIHVL